MRRTTYVYILAPLMLLLAFFSLAVPVSSAVLSNDSILGASWSIGYCNGFGRSLNPCTTVVSESESGLVNIEANASAATFLIQFPLLYSAIISHSALSYHFFVIPSQPSNLTVRFSQVTNEIYYAADIVTVDASNSTVSDGSVDMLAVRKAFTNIQGTPIRLEIDSRPSITGLLVNFQINAQDMIPFGSVLYTNYFALSGVLALAGVYYRFISVSSKFRLASSALLTLALFVVSIPIGSIVFVAWPPLSENFTWIFAFGLVLGALLLGLFVNYRREMT